MHCLESIEAMNRAWARTCAESKRHANNSLLAELLKLMEKSDVKLAVAERIKELKAQV
jgi:hypothetical protein